MSRPALRIVAQAPAGRGLALPGPDAANGPLRGRPGIRDPLTVPDATVDRMTTSLPPVIGYIRVGSPDPNTLAGQQQKRRIEEWAAETGHDVTEWVEEFGTGRAGSAFARAVARCRGKLVVAFAPSRISRDPVELQAWNTRVHAVGGQLGFVEGWPQPDSWEQATAEWAGALAGGAAESPRRVSYHRRNPEPIDQASPQRQAAAAWDYAEKLGHQVTWADGAEPDRDPREATGQD